MKKDKYWLWLILILLISPIWVIPAILLIVLIFKIVLILVVLLIIFLIATTVTEEKKGDTKKNKHAKALSAMGASRGGTARAAKLTPERRREIARQAVNTRWKKAKNKLN